MTLDKDGKVIHFTGLLMTPDGQVTKLLQRRRQAARKARLAHRHEGQGAAARLHRRARPCHGAGLPRARTRSVGHAFARRGARRRSPPMSPPIPTRNGSSAAAGTRRNGGWAASRPRPISTRWSSDRPVWLDRVDGHAGWANSAAMKAAGVTAKTRLAAGGRIEKIGAARRRVRRCRAGSWSTRRCRSRCAQGSRRRVPQGAGRCCSRFGITATDDMGTSARRLADAIAARAMPARCAMRIMSYAAGVETAIADRRATGRRRGSMATGCGWAGSSSIADGALGSRGAWLKAPYGDAPGQSGAGFMTDDSCAT